MKSVVIPKGNPDILKRGGGIKMWMWLCIEIKSYLGLGNKIGMRKIGKNIVKQKKMLGEQYKWLWIRKLERQWRFFRIVMVVSSLELPSKGLGEERCCWGIKLLEHAFKLYKKVFDGRLCEVADIDKMRYGFKEGRGTVDPVFVMRKLSEIFRAKNEMFFIFVDLEKTFDGKLFVLL